MNLLVRKYEREEKEAQEQAERALNLDYPGNPF
jgi:hypothetical protein